MTASSYQLLGNDGLRYPIGPHGLSLGRHSTNTVVIRDTTVSRHHAQILLAEGRYWVRDLESTAGTFINGQQVQGQGELRPGDTLGIGEASFQLAPSQERTPVAAVPLAAAAGSAAATPSATTIPPRSRRSQQLVYLGIGGAAILLLVLISASVSGFSSGPGILSFRTLTTFTPTPLPPADTPPPTQPPSITDTPPPATDTPVLAVEALLTCEGIGERRNYRSCTVANASPITDTLWLFFDPHQPRLNNNFRVSVVIEGQDDPIDPDRAGMVSLGEFEPNQGKIIRIQMICTAPLAGCPLTKIQVQLFAEDGTVAITGAQGAFVMENLAAGQTATPIPRPTKEPTEEAPGATNTMAPTNTVVPTATCPPDGCGP